MSYRNGTYVAFHANGTDVPIDSDIKYYNLLKAWTEKTDDDFTMVNSHEKTGAVRDSSKKQTLKASLQERLRNSKNMVLIIGETTRFDTDWIPFEIACAVDFYGIPIIAAYPGSGPILDPEQFKSLWPKALSDRINNQTVRVIHIPFKKEPIRAAIGKYSHSNLPKGSLSYFTRESYGSWGLI